MNIAIDWSKLLTKEMKEAQVKAAQLAAANASLKVYTDTANSRVAELQARIDTINDAIDGEYALPEEVAELSVRKASLAEWKKYRVLLGRVISSQGWPEHPAWPAAPKE